MPDTAPPTTTTPHSHHNDDGENDSENDSDADHVDSDAGDENPGRQEPTYDRDDEPGPWIGFDDPRMTQRKR